MKRIVLVIDHKERDLRGVVLIAFWLNAKYGIVPFITNTRNEISCLIKYRPDLILLQHVRHHHQRELLQYAKAQNTAISVSLAEGFPFSKENVIFSVGRDEYVPAIDLFLTWGKIFNGYIQNNPLTKRATIATAGSPRFDYHSSRYASLALSKGAICKELKIDAGKPLVLWLPSTVYANPPEGFDAFIKKMKDAQTSDSRIAHVIEPLSRDHQKVFNLMSGYFIRLANEFPNLNLVIKNHPDENKEVYKKVFGSYSNIKIIDDSTFPLTDLLRCADIQLNWRCTTSVESWMIDINKAVVSVEPKDVELDIVQYLTNGNDVVSEYDQLRTKISYYLNGGGPGRTLIQRREQFIKDYLFAGDGRSSERCADQIFEYIKDRPSPRRSWLNYQISMKYLRYYRFNKRWLAAPKESDHPKYVGHELIHQEMKQLMKHHNKKVEYKIEM